MLKHSEKAEDGIGIRYTIIKLAPKACPATHKPGVLMSRLVAAKPTAYALVGATGEIRSYETENRFPWLVYQFSINCRKTKHHQAAS